MAPRRARSTSSTRKGQAPAAEAMRRVAVYTRRSTDEEHQPYSIEAQTVRLDAYIQGCHEPTCPSVVPHNISAAARIGRSSWSELDATDGSEGLGPSFMDPRQRSERCLDKSFRRDAS